MKARAAAMVIALTVVTRAMSAQAPTPPVQVQTIEPDRPDVTNGVNTVPPRSVQIELGGIWTREDAGAHSYGSPATVRVGITPRFEGRLEAGGLVSQTSGGARTIGIGDVALGAKVRLWSHHFGAPPLSIQPAVNLPTASAEKGLGSGDADFTVTLLTGTDIGTRGHIDGNYRIGAVGAGNGRPHFEQQLGSVSASVQAGEKSFPWFEAYWVSREDPDGAALTAIDTGAMYLLQPRVAIDAGIQIGISKAAPNVALFGGLSFLIGRPSATSAFRPVRGRD